MKTGKNVRVDIMDRIVPSILQVSPDLFCINNRVSAKISGILYPIHFSLKQITYRLLSINNLQK